MNNKLKSPQVAISIGFDSFNSIFKKAVLEISKNPNLLTYHFFYHTEFSYKNAKTNSEEKKPVFYIATQLTTKWKSWAKAAKKEGKKFAAGHCQYNPETNTFIFKVEIGGKGDKDKTLKIIWKELIGETKYNYEFGELITDEETELAEGDALIEFNTADVLAELRALASDGQSLFHSNLTSLLESYQSIFIEVYEPYIESSTTKITSEISTIIEKKKEDLQLNRSWLENNQSIIDSWLISVEEQQKDQENYSQQLLQDTATINDTLNQLYPLIKNHYDKIIGLDQQIGTNLFSFALKASLLLPTTDSSLSSFNLAPVFDIIKDFQLVE